MDIGECMCRLEGYGYAVSGRTAGGGPNRIWMDGYGFRLELAADDSGNVTGLDCYLLNDGKIDMLLGTTAVYPTFAIRYKWVDGIGMDEMLSVLSEPGRAVMRFGTMKAEEDLGVLEG